jgi:hypothetical protein
MCGLKAERGVAPLPRPRSAPRPSLPSSPPPGFGHYINEARAAGATVITTDHPPMNELVTPETGLLVKPERTASYPHMALRDHADINAFLSPAQICAAADRALRLGGGAAAGLGRAAREGYLRGRDDVVARAGELRDELARRAAAAAAAAATGRRAAAGGGSGTHAAAAAPLADQTRR